MSKCKWTEKNSDAYGKSWFCDTCKKYCFYEVKKPTDCIKENKQTSDNPEIDKCGHCNGKAFLQFQGSFDWSQDWVECLTCHCRGPRENNATDAINYWNEIQNNISIGKEN